MDSILPMIKQLLAIYGLKVIAAIVIYIIGRWVAKGFRSLARKLLTAKGVDPTITSFTVNLVYYIILVVVVLAALGQLGIQTTTFVALIGAAGLAIALSLQSSLSNFAAGFLMIILRPFKVGDFIDGAGVSGSVQEVHIFTTKLLTSDNKIIIVPNGKLMAANITNYSTTGTRRIDMTFGIGYSDDIDHAKSVLNEILTQDKRILRDPPFSIVVVELAESSVNIAVRPWVNSSDYWGVKTETLEKVKKRFDAEGISIPFPQRDLHIYQDHECTLEEESD